ncbi:MAG: glycosyltransferase family 2 protein [candidate division WOR-3 bacterium]
MKLSIVIVTWNSAQEIEACIDSISCARPFEILVVDNGSTDGTLDRLSRYDHLKLIRNPSNTGYAHANNQGIRYAVGDYVLLLNPDTRVEPGALDILADFLDRHPEIAAVAPRLVNPDGSTQDSIRSLPTAGTVLAEILGLARLFPKSRVLGRWRRRDFDYEQPASVEQPMASCLMIRRAILELLHGFDERFPIFYNDVDLSRRMADAGLQTMYLPDARVVHKRGASTSRARTRMIWENHRSLFRYLAKHDRSGLFPLKAVVLLPTLELTALIRVLLLRLRPAR